MPLRDRCSTIANVEPIFRSLNADPADARGQTIELFIMEGR